MHSHMHCRPLKGWAWKTKWHLMTLSNTNIIWYWWQRSECLCKRSWNNPVRGKQVYLENNLYQWHFFYHKSITDWPGIKPRPTSWEVKEQPPQPWHSHWLVLYSCTCGYEVYTYVLYSSLCVLVADVCCLECAFFTKRHHNVVLAGNMARSSFWLNVWTVVLW